MVNLGFKDKIDDLYIPNGISTEIVNKMKLLVERMCSKMDVFKEETNLELHRYTHPSLQESVVKLWY